MDKSASNSCCKDVYKQIQIKAVHQPAVAAYEFLDFSQYTIAHEAVLSLLQAPVKKNKVFLLTHSPPPLFQPRLNISYCVFLI